MVAPNPDAIVMGAGLLGCGMALELAAAGCSVLLLERDGQACNRASLRNEGKIHLGLIYAADPAGETGRFQLEGALHFRSIVADWIGDAAFSRIAISTPFTYLVAADSLLSPARLEQHYAALEAHRRAMAPAGSPPDYLGRPLTGLARRVDPSALPVCLDRSGLTAAFATAERAINTDHLAREIRAALADHPRIELCCGTAVRDIRAEGDRWRVLGAHAGHSQWYQASLLFNAAWEQRVLLDRRAGLSPVAGWLHRLKYRVIARVPPALQHAPSITIVLGRYGDVVIRPDHTAYLSWYPAGLQGWSHADAPPDAWDQACRGQAPAAVTEPIAAAVLAGLTDWMPALAGAEVLQVDAGVIVAYGTQDVDVADSGLHVRHACCHRQASGYFSVDAGKLTTVPLIARRTVAEALACRVG